MRLMNLCDKHCAQAPALVSGRTGICSQWPSCPEYWDCSTKSFYLPGFLRKWKLKRRKDKTETSIFFTLPDILSSSEVGWLHYIFENLSLFLGMFLKVQINALSSLVYVASVPEGKDPFPGYYHHQRQLYSLTVTFLCLYSVLYLVLFPSHPLAVQSRACSKPRHLKKNPHGKRNHFLSLNISLYIDCVIILLCLSLTC